MPVTSENCEDFRVRLQFEWLERKRHTPDFSLRKFAKFFDMDPTALQRIMSGQRRVTEKTFQRMATKLGFSQKEKEHYRSSVLPNKGRPPKKPKPTSVEKSEGPSYTALDRDVTEVLANWYYNAILEMPYLDAFRLDHQWMAKKLGLSVQETQIAIDTLKRLKLIEITDDGDWIDHYDHMTNIRPGVTTPAMRQLQHQILAKAQKALEERPVTDRDQTSITFAGDSRLLDKARELTKEYRRALNQLMQSSQKNDQVYQLTIALFPLTT